MPVQAQRRRVVFELAPGRLEDGLDHVLHGFARMHLRFRQQDGVDVDVGDVALEHAVGEEDQPVARHERQRLHLVRVTRHDPERRVGPQRHGLDAPAAQPKR